MTLKEDYDLTMKCLWKYGKVLRFTRGMAQYIHRTNAGGACDVRSYEQEIYNIKYLKWLHGDSIFKYNWSKYVKMTDIGEIPDCLLFEDDSSSNKSITVRIDKDTSNSSELLTKFGFMKIREGMALRSIKYRGG